MSEDEKISIPKNVQVFLDSLLTSTSQEYVLDVLAKHGEKSDDDGLWLATKWDDALKKYIASNPNDVPDDVKQALEMKGVAKEYHDSRASQWVHLSNVQSARMTLRYHRNLIADINRITNTPDFAEMRKDSPAYETFKKSVRPVLRKIVDRIDLEKIVEVPGPAEPSEPGIWTTEITQLISQFNVAIESVTTAVMQNNTYIGDVSVDYSAMQETLAAIKAKLETGVLGGIPDDLRDMIQDIYKDTEMLPEKLDAILYHLSGIGGMVSDIHKDSDWTYERVAADIYHAEGRIMERLDGIEAMIGENYKPTPENPESEPEEQPVEYDVPSNPDEPSTAIVPYNPSKNIEVEPVYNNETAIVSYKEPETIDADYEIIDNNVEAEEPAETAEPTVEDIVEAETSSEPSVASSETTPEEVNYQNLYLQAKAARRNYDFATALNLLNQAKDNYERDDLVYAELSTVHSMLGNSEAAIQACQMVMKTEGALEEAVMVARNNFGYNLEATGRAEMGKKYKVLGPEYSNMISIMYLPKPEVTVQSEAVEAPVEPIAQAA